MGVCPMHKDHIAMGVCPMHKFTSAPLHSQILNSKSSEIFLTLLRQTTTVLSGRPRRLLKICRPLIKNDEWSTPDPRRSASPSTAEDLSTTGADPCQAALD